VISICYLKSVKPTDNSTTVESTEVLCPLFDEILIQYTMRRDNFPISVQNVKF